MTEREQEVVAVAALAAKAAEEERSLLEMLCRSAVRYWEGRLRQDAAPEAYGDAFCCAAAYCGGRPGGEPGRGQRGCLHGRGPLCENDGAVPWGGRAAAGRGAVDGPLCPDGQPRHGRGVRG